MMDRNKKFPHKCEVCGKYEMLSAEEAFVAGWDYPPDFGKFGVLSIRTCPDCEMTQTTWWKVIQSRHKLIYKFHSLEQLADYIKSAVDDPSIDDVGFTMHDYYTVKEIMKENEQGYEN